VQYNFSWVFLFFLLLGSLFDLDIYEFDLIGVVLP